MIVNIDGIPVYNAILSDEDTGMFKISLVDEPAVMSNFVAFDKAKKPLIYAIANEEKRIVRGVVMRADFPIYRYDKDFGEYYIIYKADTIREMAEKYLLESRQNDVNLMHEEGSDVDGVQMVQYFIKDTDAGVNPTGFDDIADGSLFAEFHIVNDEVWEQVKDGTFKGYSLEGVFNLVPEQNEEMVNAIVESLEGKFNNFFKNINMSRFKRFMARLSKALVEFANVTTDKGVLSWDGEEDLKVGDSVFIEDAEGNRTPAEEGDYKTDEGKVIKVADGKVTEITDADTEVDPEEEQNLASVATDNGELMYDGELEVGTEVFVADEEGNRTPAADGDYVTEDGKTIRVAEGKVTEIVEAEPESEEEETPPSDVAAKKQSIFSKIAEAFTESYDEKTKKMLEAIYALGYSTYGWIWEAGDDYAIFCYCDDNTGWQDTFLKFAITWDEAGDPVVGDSIEVKRSFVPVDEPNPTEQVETLSKENAELKKQVAELKKKPLAKSAHEEVVTTFKMEKTGDKGLDKIASRFVKK